MRCGLLGKQDTIFSCKVHPESIVVSAGLGNVTVVDASLEEGHPYRKACQPREGEATSFVQVVQTVVSVAATLGS